MPGPTPPPLPSQSRLHQEADYGAEGPGEAPSDSVASFPGGASGKEPSCQHRRCKRWWVRSLGQEDPLKKEMATHSSILPRRIPWTEEPSGLQSTGAQRLRHN